MTEEKLAPTDLVELYRFFESNGSQDKLLMIAIVSPLLTIFTGILGYLSTTILQYVTSNLTDKDGAVNDIQLLGYAVFSLAGFLISCLVAYVVREFLIHAEENYRKADAIGEHLQELIKQETFKSYKSLHKTEKYLFPIEDKRNKNNKKNMFCKIRTRNNWTKIGPVFIIFYMCSMVPPVLFLFLSLMAIILAARNWCPA